MACWCGLAMSWSSILHREQGCNRRASTTSGQRGGAFS
jgi:hypothetical protein